VIEKYIIQSPDPGDEEGGFEKLTEREHEVLQLIAEGFSNREIAEKLNLSIKTVGVHRTNIMEKLGVHNLSSLVKYALRKGIISLE
jgi:two-component system, NarL family, response regulator NreC